MKKLNIIIGILFLLSVSAKAQVYTLDSCKLMAVENNYKMKNAALDIEIAKQTKSEAFTHYFPKIDAMGVTFRSNHKMMRKDLDFSFLSPIIPFFAKPVRLEYLDRGTVANIMALQPLFVGGQIVNANKLAKVGKEASILQLYASVDDINKKTEEYFWKIVYLRDRMKTIETLQKQLEQIHKDVDLAVKTGLVNMNELLRVEIKQQELESNALQLENGISVSKLLLSQHIGAFSKDFDIEIDSFEMPIAPVAFYLNPEDAVLQRTECKLLDKKIEAEKLRTRIESGKRMPMVGVGGGFVHHDLLKQSHNFGIAFAAVRVPISKWWGGSHAVKRAKIKVMQAENDKENALEMMSLEIQKTWNDLQEAYKQILLTQKTTSSATENLRLNTNYYNVGVSSLSDFLEAQSLLQKSRDKYSEACSNYQIKLAHYKSVTKQQ